jgi:homoserine O-acetyltransferase
MTVLLALLSIGAALPQPHEGDFIVRGFRFKSGEVLPETRLHYATYGKPFADSTGRIANAVMILHGTTGSGQQFTGERFAGVLFGPGQLLDATRYFIILPDSIGHGRSSKPSDGLRAKFPHYDYDDMVELQRRLLVDGLKVDHLRLLLGTSMGCMHSFVWAEAHPDFMDAVMPLACLPVQIAGRNRMMRKMILDSVHTDPRAALDVFLIMTSSALQMQKEFPTREQADAHVEEFIKMRAGKLDADDTWYAFDASRTYQPSAGLSRIGAPLTLVNSADDVINPPELGIAEREIRNVKRGRFVLLPIDGRTRGHGTHSLPSVWKQYLEELLAESGQRLVR